MEETWELAVVSKEKDSAEITLSTDGFGFKTDGEASQRLAHAALDFLSPLTDGAGFLGTKLRGYRMAAALKATVRAKQICDDNNLNINPVDPKFMLQWIEGASMEDANDGEDLSELWANLLVSAATMHNDNEIFFVDFIKKMQRRHVELLAKISDKEMPKIWAMSYGKREIQNKDLLGNAFHKSLNFHVNNTVKSLEKIYPNFGKQIEKKRTNTKFLKMFFARFSKDVFDSRGILVSSYWVQINGPEKNKQFFGDGDDGGKLKKNFDFKIKKKNLCKNYKDIFPSLSAINLIEHNRYTAELFNNTVVVVINYICPTQFGWEFIEACGRSK